MEFTGGFTNYSSPKKNMKKYSKFITSFLIGVIAFTSALTVSFTVYAYSNRNEPILYRSQDGDDDWYATIFVQNPFRDKTKEIIADNFLDSIKGKTVTESLDENKNVAFNNPQGSPEKGKLVKWELWNRFDGEDETKFSYAIYRENGLDKPKRGRYLLSFVFLTLNKENSEWKVIKYFCHGTSNNS
ncbi:hypothetical protein BH20ACI1_BH20ACI1_12090 [soil metagenome]